MQSVQPCSYSLSSLTSMLLLFSRYDRFYLSKLSSWTCFSSSLVLLSWLPLAQPFASSEWTYLTLQSLLWLTSLLFSLSTFGRYCVVAVYRLAEGFDPSFFTHCVLLSGCVGAHGIVTVYGLTKVSASSLASLQTTIIVIHHVSIQTLRGIWPFTLSLNACFDPGVFALIASQVQLLSPVLLFYIIPDIQLANMIDVV